MTVPSHEHMMLPFLRFLGDEKEHSLRETIEHVSDAFNLSSEEKKPLLVPSISPALPR